jgi:hypothetical protein
MCMRLPLHRDILLPCLRIRIARPHTTNTREHGPFLGDSGPFERALRDAFERALGELSPPDPALYSWGGAAPDHPVGGLPPPETSARSLGPLVQTVHRS